MNIGLKHDAKREARNQHYIYIDGNTHMWCVVRLGRERACDFPSMCPATAQVSVRFWKFARKYYKEIALARKASHVDRVVLSAVISLLLHN